MHWEMIQLFDAKQKPYFIVAMLDGEKIVAYINHGCAVKRQGIDGYARENARHYKTSTSAQNTIVGLEKGLFPTPEAVWLLDYIKQRGFTPPGVHHDEQRRIARLARGKKMGCP